MVQDSLSLLGEVYLCLSILVVFSYLFVYQPIFIKSRFFLSLVYLVFFILLFTFIIIFYNVENNAYAFFLLFEVSYYTQICKLFLVFINLFIIFLFYVYFKETSVKDYEYLILYLLSILGMLFLISSVDILTLYLSLEVQSFCLYILSASNKNKVSSTEASLKYYILGGLSSGILLFGCSLIYGSSGMTFLEDIQIFLMGFEGCSHIFNFSFLVGFYFIIVGLLFKLGAAPFHIWVSDVYTGSPLWVTSFFATIPKVVIFLFMLKIFYVYFFDFFIHWQFVLILSLISSLVIGTFGSLYQLNLKRLLAYSGIGHVGFFLMGVCSGNTWGISAGFFYIFVYVFLSLGIFLVIMSLKNVFNFERLYTLYFLRFLSKSNLGLGLILSIFFFSLAGIPPLAGFYSKLFLFRILLESNLYFIVFLGICCSVISSFYYIRVIRLVFFDKIFRLNHFLIKVPLISGGLLSIFFFYNLLIFLDFDIFFKFFNFVSLNLFLI